MNVTQFVAQIATDDFSDEASPNLFRPGDSILEEQISKKERELAVEFPASYKELLNKYGALEFFRTSFVHPVNLYSFDDSSIEMEGFIPFAHDPFNHFYAFNLEMEVVKGTASPFGHGYICPHFEDWLVMHHRYNKDVWNHKDIHLHPYVNAAYEIKDSWSRIRKIKSQLNKRWWQFWK